MRFLTEADVRGHLTMAQAIELVEAGLRHWSAGAADNHPRRRLQLDLSATLHYMAAVDLESGYLGAKIYTTHPKTPAHFLVLLYGADGAPLAVIEANALGQIRTGAASGVATRHLARPDARVVGLIGSGFQAETQLEAVAQVRPLELVRVYSRRPENRERFAAAMAQRLGLAIEAVDSAERAVREADLVITATNARDPVLAGDWLRPGVHVNAVGSNHARRRELDLECFRRAALVVADSVEQARLESGDLIAACEAGLPGWDQVAELKDFPVRRRDEDITIFKSNGLALEDVAVAAWVYRQVAAIPTSEAADRPPARR